ncbi:MAG: glutamate-cysteine ligase family protein [Thermodesulfobacteriota bacterium]
MKGPGLFAGFGLELEYMLVDAGSLAVLPKVDQLLAAAAGAEVADEVERGAFAWSNELALHVVEIKNREPVPELAGLEEGLQAEVRALAGQAAALGGRLLPSGMHPWMDPVRETRLWPHGQQEIYRAYHRIFGCQGHGWGNLQSVHLNLAFQGDTEFARLHAGLRLLLPLMPALAASSPFVEGRPAGRLDSRLGFYRENQRRIPAIIGQVVPEPVYSQAAYEAEILAATYRQIRPFDPAGLLQHEWLNSRGVIARFERSALEVRVLDIQECPLADVSIAVAIVAVLRALVAERWSDWASQAAMPTESLARLFHQAVDEADGLVIRDRDYLDLLGCTGTGAVTAAEVWGEMLALAVPPEPYRGTVARMLRRGPLARRLLRAAGPEPSRAVLVDLYRELADCLAAGELFRA